MVNDIDKIARLLEIPNLEPETVTLINKTIRQQLEALGQAPASPSSGSIVLPPTVLDEWFNGETAARRESV